MALLKNKKNFVLLFNEELEPVHLQKDVGMIPFYLQKTYQIDISLVFATEKKVKNQTFNSNIKAIPRVLFTKNTTLNKLNRYFLLSLYLLKKSKKIDYLMLFHLSLITSIYINLYRTLKPKGKIFLKLDTTETQLNYITRNKLRKKILEYSMAKCNLISCETTNVLLAIKTQFPNISDSITLIPNGIHIELPVHFKPEKVNLIITVGRIGAQEKNHELLLDALNLVDLKDWRFQFIGPVSDTFRTYFEKHKMKSPEKFRNIELYGQIDDRKTLFDIYSKAKIFCLTSNFESYCFALLEAAFFDNYIISTNVGAASDLIKLTEKGELIQPNPQALAKAISKSINENLWTKTCNAKNTQFLWQSVLENKEITSFFYDN